jgi:uncharacterized iron-regulated membrane protein
MKQNKATFFAALGKSLHLGSLLTPKKILFGAWLCAIIMSFLAMATYGRASHTAAPMAPVPQNATPATLSPLGAGCSMPPERLLGASLVDAVRTDDGFIAVYTIKNDAIDLSTRFAVEASCLGELRMLLAHSFLTETDTSVIPRENYR